MIMLKYDDRGTTVRHVPWSGHVKTIRTINLLIAKSNLITKPQCSPLLILATESGANCILLAGGIVNIRPVPQCLQISSKKAGLAFGN